MAGRPAHGTEPVLESFCDALEGLLVEDGVAFHEITATELSRRAGVSRRTFYRHFSKMEDVLDACARRSALAMAQRAEPLLEELGDYQARQTLIFEHMDENRDLLRALKRSDMLSRFLGSFWNTYGPGWVSSRLDAGEREQDRQRQQERLATFSTGALSAIIEDWVDDPEAPAAAEMGPIMEELVQSMPQLLKFDNQTEPPAGVE